MVESIIDSGTQKNRRERKPIRQVTNRPRVGTPRAKQLNKLE